MRRLVFIFVLLLVGSVFGADIEVQEVASGDDADSSNTGWSITGDPLLLGDNGEAAAWRFLNIAIPQGATIDSAWIMFQACDGNTNDSARVNFYCEDTSSATVFSTAADFDGRILTSSSVYKVLEDWTFADFFTTRYITGPVQEVINRGDWSSGNNLAVIVRDAGADANTTRSACSYDRTSSSRTTLYIDFTPAGGGKKIGKAKLGKVKL